MKPNRSRSLRGCWPLASTTNCPSLSHSPLCIQTAVVPVFSVPCYSIKNLVRVVLSWCLFCCRFTPTNNKLTIHTIPRMTDEPNTAALYQQCSSTTESSYLVCAKIYILQKPNSVNACSTRSTCVPQVDPLSRGEHFAY